MRYLMPKPPLTKNRSGTIKPIAGEDKKFFIFPNGISLKVKIIEQLEFEITFYNVAIQYVNYNEN